MHKCDIYRHSPISRSGSDPASEVTYIVPGGA